MIQQNPAGPRPHYKPVAQLKDAETFRAYAASLRLDLPIDDVVEPAPGGPLAQPYTLAAKVPHGGTPAGPARVIGNRFCILPMEGWDGTPDGLPTELTERRWRNFGLSGAKLIFGGEAAAVRHEGRANPRQLMMIPETMKGMESLRRALAEAHAERFGETADLVIGLQLTHSGRFCRPDDNKKPEPKIAYHHPLLDRLFGISPDFPLITDGELEGLIGDFVKAGTLAGELGFDFVDVKACHGYLGHELLSAFSRPGPYGGNLRNRSRFMREIIRGLKRDAPALRIGVRLSAFDFPPFRPDAPGGTGRCLHGPEDGEYPYAFGADPENPQTVSLGEVFELIGMLRDLGTELVCVTAGSPYYNPHIQRPALFPPSDGYAPPEDPLAGVARQMRVTSEIKAEFPDLAVIGSAYTYLQEWLPHAAQRSVREGRTDFAGLGRMVLSYPGLPEDVLAGRPLNRKRICRTLSECTTAPRKGLVSGCYPLDPFYRDRTVRRPQT
ncbi:MAG: NADH:flavin oxidoreductase [Spirochaetales bacterium]|nr:MAG: NADH:flavin oxidoreductase [Spirochaetales bacterium]